MIKIKYCVLLLFFWQSCAIATNVVRGPYLQTPTDNSMIIRWRTDTATDSRVQYGTSLENLEFTAIDKALTKEHSVTVTGLNPNTGYFYNLGSTTEVQAGDASYFFETSATAGVAVPTRIWVIGDAGKGNRGQKNVYKAYRKYTWNKYTDFWLMLGDNAYNSGTDDEYQKNMFDIYPVIMRTSPLWAAIGNHDGRSADSTLQTGPYYEQHSFPKNGEAGGVASGTEAYYSFNYGNIHVIVLDSHDSPRSADGAMMKWLKTDLASVTATWLLAIWHHPPYSKGSHDSDTEGRMIEMREIFLPVLEKHGVDLVLTGHSHSYERSKLIYGHYDKSNTFGKEFIKDAGSGNIKETGAYAKNSDEGNIGTVYIVMGSSGEVHGGKLNHPAMQVSLNTLGSMMIDIDGYTMNIKYLNAKGKVMDEFSLVKKSNR